MPTNSPSHGLETPVWRPATAAPALLGESPFWHPDQQCLYYCDIAAKRLHRFHPGTGECRHWQFDSEVASCAPFRDGSLLLALRNGLWRFDPVSGRQSLIAAPPYDPSGQRFNDGKCDPQGRFWVGTLHDRREPQAALYCWTSSLGLREMAGGITVSNGLAWSPDGRTLYWSDTTSHAIDAFDLDPESGAVTRRRAFARFPVKAVDQDLALYGGRPDGAAVDSDGNYWVAMYEGARLLCLSPQGQLLHDVPLPVRCPTMPCFGGVDLKTLYVTTARHGRPQTELAKEPMAGCVMALAVSVPGLPTNFCAEF